MRLYHHSPAENRASILKHGLLCSEIGSGAIYFSNAPTPQPGFDIWVAESYDIAVEPDLTTEAPAGEEWCVTYRNIRPHNLRILETT